MRTTIPPLGTRVRVRAKLTRHYTFDEHDDHMTMHGTWVPVAIEPTQGIVCGKRTICDTVGLHYFDGPSEWKSKRYYPCLMVAINLRSIVRALPEDVEIIEEVDGGEA